MEHVSQVLKLERSGRVSPSDIEAGALAVVARLIPEIPSSHLGAWHYNPHTGRLAARVVHSAIAVTLQLRIPEIKRALAAEFPGRVKEILVRTGPPRYLTD